MYTFYPDTVISTPREVYLYFSQEQIFEAIIGERPDFNKKYLSPFRKDNYPNCYFREVGGVIYFVDWVLGTKDAVGSFKELYGLSLKDTIEAIIYSFKPEKTEKKITLSQSIKSPTLIIPHKRNWEKRDINYWTNRYGITIDNLEEDNVFAVSDFLFRKKDKWKHVSILDICYAISAKDNFKIYRPLAPKINKWLSNISKDEILGKYEYPNESIIITKSYKDYRTIFNLIGGNVVWLQSEGCIPESIDNFLQPFSEVIILYDNDNAGISASNRLSKNLSCKTRLVFSDISYIKDVSEMYCFKGKSFTEKWLRDILNVGKNS